MARFRARSPVALLLLSAALAAGAPGDPALRLADLQGRAVDPFEGPADVKAFVFLFTSTECPISNRYAPEVRRLFETFGPRGVVFRLVYVNPRDSAEAIRSHLDAFGYTMPALRDPRHELVARAGATVTPEAAVFDPSRRLLYHGRIDDRYVELGRDRPAPTRHDLEDALRAVLAGQSIAQPATRAVGCFLADFRRR